MASGTPVAARIPSSENEKVDDLILAKHGSLTPYKAQFIESAMRMFMDEDHLAETETALGEIESLLSETFGDYSRRRTSSTTTPRGWDDGETTRIGVRIDPELKERFQKWVGENTDRTYGKALALALREYRQGSREQRVSDRVESIQSELQDLVGDNPSVDAASAENTQPEAASEMPYHTDEKVERIKQELEEAHEMALSDIEAIPKQSDDGGYPGLVDLIHKYCARGDGDTASEKTVQKFTTLLMEDIGLDEHPSGRIFVQSDDAGDTSDIAYRRKEYGQLTTSERVEGVRVRLLEMATAGRGSQLSAAKIQGRVFNGEPSDSVAHKLRDRTAQADGFGIRTSGSGETCVYVEPDNVLDDDLRTAAGLATIDERAEIEQDASDAMDQYEAATPVRADGGATIEGDI